MRFGKKPTVVEVKKTRSCVVRLENVTKKSPNITPSPEVNRSMTRANRASSTAMAVTAAKARRGVILLQEEKTAPIDTAKKKIIATASGPNITKNAQTPQQIKVPNSSIIANLKSNQKVKIIPKTNKTPTPQTPTPSREPSPPATIAAGRSRRAIKPNPKYASEDMVTPKVVRNVGMKPSNKSVQSSGPSKNRKASSSSDDFYNSNSEDESGNNEKDGDNEDYDNEADMSTEEKDDADSDFSVEERVRSSRARPRAKKPQDAVTPSAIMLQKKFPTQPAIIKRPSITNTPNSATIHSAPSQLQQIRRSLATANAKRNLNLLVGGSGVAQKRKLEDTIDIDDIDSNLSSAKRKHLMPFHTPEQKAKLPVRDNKVNVLPTSLNRTRLLTQPQQQSVNGSNKNNSIQITRRSNEFNAKSQSETIAKTPLMRHSAVSYNSKADDQSPITAQARLLASKAQRFQSGPPKIAFPKDLQKNGATISISSSSSSSSEKMKTHDTPTTIKSSVDKSTPPSTVKSTSEKAKPVTTVKSTSEKSKSASAQSSTRSSVEKAKPASTQPSTRSSAEKAKPASVQSSTSKSSVDKAKSFSTQSSSKAKPISSLSTVKSKIEPSHKISAISTGIVHEIPDDSPNSTIDDFETMPTFTIVNVNDIINKKGDVLISKTKSNNSTTPMVIECSESISLDDDDDNDKGINSNNNNNNDDVEEVESIFAAPARPKTAATKSLPKLPTRNNKKELEKKKPSLNRSNESSNKPPEILNHKLGLRNSKVSPKTATTKTTLTPPAKPAPRILNSMVAKKTQPVKPMITNMDDSAEESFPLSLDEDDDEDAEQETEDDVEIRKKTLKLMTDKSRKRKYQNSYEQDTDDTDSQITEYDEEEITLQNETKASALTQKQKVNQQERIRTSGGKSDTPSYSVSSNKKRLTATAAKENSLAATNQQNSDTSKQSMASQLPTRKTNNEKIVISKQGDKIIKKITCFETWYVINTPAEPQRPTTMKNQLDMTLIRLANIAAKICLPNDRWTTKVTLYEVSAQALVKGSYVTYTGDLAEHSISEEDRFKYQPSCIMFRRSVDKQQSSRMPYDRAVIFKNKTFYTNIEGKNIRLIGAPSIINTESEIQILLQVVDSLSLDSDFVEHVSIMQ